MVRTITVQQRRDAMINRHHLAGGAAGPEAVTRALVGLHATDSASVYLSVRARSAVSTLADVADAMYEQRSLVRWMAMRRTLFVFACDDIPTVQAAVSTPLAATLRRSFISRLQRNGSEPRIEGDLGRWLAELEDRTEDALARRGTATGTQLGDDEPALRVFYTETMNFGEPDGAFADADRVVSAMIDSARVTHVPMEGRGGVADYRPGTEELTYHAASQAPHSARQALAALLKHPADRLRVVIPDIGGAFGQKAGLSREDLVVCAAAKMLGRPVKWVEDRIENLAAAGHAREETMEIGAAVKNDGTILALDVKMRLNQGAYPMLGTPTPLFGWIVRTMIGNAYRINHLRWSLGVYASNKASYSAYRGPWAAETLAREIVIDRIAHELALDPVDVRRRNLLTLEEQPRKMMSGATIEAVAAIDALERAVEIVDYDGFRVQQHRAREQGRLLGVGFSTYIEPAPGPPDFFSAIGFTIGGERAVARLEPDGHLTVITTQAPHGQSHETTLAQIAATEFGVPMSHVRVLYGDTNTAPYSSMGTGGSRAATMASGAALHATRRSNRRRSRTPAACSRYHLTTSRSPRRASA